MIVGLVPEATYTSYECNLQRGDRILLTTDGITEAEDKSGRQFGDAGVAALVHLSSLDAMLDHLARFQASGEAQDDWTLLDVRYEGM